MGVFVTELYELFVYFGNKALLVSSFINIFSHSVICLFVSFVVSFVVQKLLSLIWSHLFIFSFIFITLGDGSQKILLMGGEFGGEWILVYIRLSHFAVHLKLSQHC